MKNLLKPRKRKWFFGLNVPFALTAKGWREWETRTKKERLVAWFFRKTLWENGLLKFWKRRIFNPIHNLYWAFNHRFIPKHQYNIVRMGLAPGYYDSDQRMLHACFTLLKDYVEHEADTIDWAADEEHQDAWKELSDLYHWWTAFRPVRKLPEITSLPDDLKDLAIFDADKQDRPEVIRWHEEAEARNEMQEQWEDEDDAMLQRLVAIRTRLWS